MEEAVSEPSVVGECIAEAYDAAIDIIDLFQDRSGWLRRPKSSRDEDLAWLEEVFGISPTEILPLTFLPEKKRRKELSNRLNAHLAISEVEVHTPTQN